MEYSSSIFWTNWREHDVLYIPITLHHESTDNSTDSTIITILGITFAPIVTPGLYNSQMGVIVTISQCSLRTLSSLSLSELCTRLGPGSLWARDRGGISRYRGGTSHSLGRATGETFMGRKPSSETAAAGCGPGDAGDGEYWAPESAAAVVAVTAGITLHKLSLAAAMCISCGWWPSQKCGDKEPYRVCPQWIAILNSRL